MGRSSAGERLANNSKRPKEESQDLPSAPEVERACLAAVLFNELAYHELVAFGLKSDYFTVEANRRIFRVMQSLVQDQKQAIDMVMLCDGLQKSGELEKVGGMAYISELTTGAIDLVRGQKVQSRVEILREKYQRRQLIHLATQATACAYDPSDPITFTTAQIQADILRLQGDTARSSIQSLSEFSTEVLAGIEEMMHRHPDEPLGVPFGIQELDDTTTGMRPGQLIVLGGFPKSGKTSFAIDVCRKIVKAGKPVGFFSREMRKNELIERLWAQESDVPYFKVRKPTSLSISEFRALQDVKAKSDLWPLYIDDNVEHISELIPRAHLMIHRHKVELIVLDYLQVLGAPGEKSFEKVTNAVNSLTAFAKNTGVPVLCLSQLTRPEKKELNSMPNMSMLRESGQIEMNAHIIIFTFHPRDQDTQVATGEDLIILGAQRAGPTGRIKTFFNVVQQRWEERGLKVEEPQPKQEEIF